VVSLNLKRHQEDKVFLMKRCKSFHLQKLLKKNFFLSGIRYLLNMPNGF